MSRRDRPVLTPAEAALDLIQLHDTVLHLRALAGTREVRPLPPELRDPGYSLPAPRPHPLIKRPC